MISPRSGQWAIVLALGIIFPILMGTPACENKKPLSPLEVPQPGAQAQPKAAAWTPVPEGSPNPIGNLLKNPGFEEGRGGWFWMDWSKAWVDFDITDKKARGGKQSAWLHIEPSAGTTDIQVHGVVQTLTPSRFPSKVGGWYMIQNWKRGAEKQYLQFVVIVWGGHPEYKNWQIRYVITGATEPPHSMANAKYRFMPDAAYNPAQNKWIYFEAPIKKDFQTYWGMVPTGYEKINFFFEARYDTPPEQGKSFIADVYYDDLFVGDE